MLTKVAEVFEKAILTYGQTAQEDVAIEKAMGTRLFFKKKCLVLYYKRIYIADKVPIPTFQNNLLS